MDKFIKFSKMVNTFKTAAIEKVSDLAVSSIHALTTSSTPQPQTPAQPKEDPPIQTKPELTPTQRAVQAFLASSKIEGYTEPFMMLDAIKNMPYAHTTANHINQAMCIIRYLCKGDFIFCHAALDEMLKLLSLPNAHDPSTLDFLKAGTNATHAEEFWTLFKDNPNDAWNHLYIISLKKTSDFGEFTGLIQAIFNTTKQPYPNEISQIPHNESSNITGWIQQCNEIIAPQDLMLVELNCHQESLNYTLMKRFEYTVLKGMLQEIRIQNWIVE